MKLTLDQRAARITTKRNNQTKRALPLLAATNSIPAEMLTSQEEQRVRLIRMGVKMDEYFKRLEAYNQQTALRAEHLRQVVSEIMPADQFSRVDALFQQRLETWRAYQQPAYRADFWWCQLKEIDPLRAEEMRGIP